MNLYEKSLTYDESVYNLLKTRIMIKQDVMKFILEKMDLNDRDGVYKAEILSESKFSDTVIRPALNSLYCTGFIDMKKRGTTDTYYLNANSRRLLEEIRGIKK